MLVSRLVGQFGDGITSIKVIASSPIGTQQEELSGDPKFSTPIAAVAIPVASPQCVASQVWVICYAVL